jgi:hypothetical protein
MSEESKSVLDWWQRSRSRRLSNEVTEYPRAAFAVVPYITDTSSKLPGCCAYVEGKVSEHSEARLCKVDGCYCSPLIFKNSDVFKDCNVRLALLAKKDT